MQAFRLALPQSHFRRYYHIQHSLGDCKLESEDISFKFARLLFDSPHIIDLIHIIVLRVYLIYDLAERSRVTLIDALMKLTSLHSLRMASAFQDLHPMMRPVLEHLLRHSTLTELFVTGMCGLPVSYLANCSNLTHLALEDTGIFYDWDVLPSTFVLSKLLRLEEFSCAIRLPRSGPTNAGQKRAATLLIESLLVVLTFLICLPSRSFKWGIGTPYF